MTEHNKAPTAGREMRYRVLSDRMPPVPVEKMSDEQKKVASQIAAGPRGKVEGPYWPILRSPGFAEVIQHVGAYFRYGCRLDRKINEMAALMAARSWSQPFVWDVHILQALDAGLAAEKATALAEGRRPEKMTEDEETLWDFVSELLVTKGVSDPTYRRAVDIYGESGVVDILGILGYYTTLSMIMNVGRTDMLDGRNPPLDPTPNYLKCLEADPLRSRTTTGAS
jgi:4-carboxymuconolactone decarboxylase